MVDIVFRILICILAYMGFEMLHYGYTYYAIIDFAIVVSYVFEVVRESRFTK